MAGKMSNEESLLLEAEKPNNHSDKQNSSKRHANNLLMSLTISLGIFCVVGVLLYRPNNSRENSLSELNAYSGYKLDQCHNIPGQPKVMRTECCTDPSLPVLGGIDLVSLYFSTPGTLPEVGKPEFSASIKTSSAEYVFYFVNTENRDIFEENPWKYAPAYGGFDSCGVSLEERSRYAENVKDLGPSVDISKWEMIEGKLFFFGGKNPREHFLSAPDAKFLGDQNWENYFGFLPENGLFNTNCFHGQSYFALMMGKESLESCRSDHGMMLNRRLDAQKIIISFEPPSETASSRHSDTLANMLNERDSAPSQGLRSAMQSNAGLSVAGTRQGSNGMSHTEDSTGSGQSAGSLAVCGC